MNIEQVLNLIKDEIEAMDPVPKEYLVSNGNNNGFEKLVPLIAENVSTKIKEHGDILEITAHLGHHFPDMDLKLNGIKFGLELKSRSNGEWTTNGNSVMESISDPDYEEIFLMFGSKVKKENRLLVRHAPYWQTTKAIKVTHSPRFVIDIRSGASSVFESKVEYDTLRELNDDGKVKFLQDYLRNNSNEAKWYTSEKEQVMPTYFNDLPEEERLKIKADLFIQFPKDLIGNSQNDYKRSAEHLINFYFVYVSNLRDIFSASGKFKYENIEFSRVYKNLQDSSQAIHDFLNEANSDYIEKITSGWIRDELIETSSGDVIADYYKALNMAAKKNAELTNKLNTLGFSNLTDFVFG
ncbi:hypothetical protein ACFSY7_11640 [Kurthia populi]|uniref:Restriction endonuclease n=1 Tax=Kurthia populi TaxID=1562132 RepID=A0ABW5Y2Z0_9BACL